MALTGKVVLIAGASGGLGTSVVEAFLAVGATVIAAARRRTRLSELTAAMRGHDRLSAAESDVADPEMVEKLFDSVERDKGPIHGAVSLVGSWAGGPFVALDDRTYRSLVATNLDSAVFFSRAALRRMAGRGVGHVVLAGSMASRRPSPDAVVYGAVKAALEHMVGSIAAELRAGGSAVTINALLPGTMDTPDNRAAMPDADPRTWTRPADVAAMAVRLCTTDGRGVSGAAITLP